ncbi:hypothetical protein [Companilactobacillus hulinensis]|uniref:hypothetical protein n=1 Tax=Companilactobacillus hulinensis TaxID=2486007 RepID=UPI000F7B5215|nr:hypothetical protein [Companilactobacillus hulinensis]
MTNDYQAIIGEMIEQKQNETLEEKRDNTRHRNIRMAGIINDYLHKKFDKYVIVTGGLSVEYYTQGNYTTQDIDFVTPSVDDLNEALLDLGFESIGKYWQYEKLEIFVELVSNNSFDGKSKTPTKFQTEDRLEVEFTDVADILLDRIRGIVYWNTKEYEYWSYQLLKEHRSSIEDDYMFSRLEGISEVEEYESLVKWVDQPDAVYSKVKTFEWLLMNDEVEYIYKPVNDTYIFYFPISGELEGKLESSFFGIRILQKIYFLLYNTEEEEFEESSEEAAQSISMYIEEYKGIEGIQIFEIVYKYLKEAHLI